MFLFFFGKLLPNSFFYGIISIVVRECWNWQTGKTKDLVGVCSCGFKSHFPHYSFERESLIDKGSLDFFRNSAFPTIDYKVLNEK